MGCGKSKIAQPAAGSTGPVLLGPQAQEATPKETQTRVAPKVEAESAVQAFPSVQANEVEVGKRPFFLFVRIKVKPGKLDEYLKLAEVADTGVGETESGMLFHTFNQDPNDPLTFCWSEIYANDDAFFFHGGNKGLLDYVATQAPLTDGWTVDVYGSVRDDTKQALNGFGFPTQYHELAPVGYYRPVLTSEQRVTDKTQLASLAEGKIPDSQPFLLLARIDVMEGKMDEYLQLMKEADDGVNATEPGMLFHTVNIDPEKKGRICWTELYQNDDAFFAHGKNPKLLDHVAKQADLQVGWTIEVYGSLKPETKEFIKGFGFPTNFHEIKLGYCRTCCTAEEAEGKAAQEEAIREEAPKEEVPKEEPAKDEASKEELAPDVQKEERDDETPLVVEEKVAPNGGCIFCACA